jgi:hypothetical protein
MPEFWTRTRRYMAAVWLGTAALEAVALVLAHRFNDSWFLLVAAAVLILPFVGWELSARWLERPRRKRWKRHDLEAAATAQAAAPPPPPAAGDVGAAAGL